MNVITSEWIQVKDSSGQDTKIRPLDIGSRPQALSAGLWEVDNGSLLLLIALAQTYLAPDDSREWKRLWDNPPGPEEFLEAIGKDVSAFEMFGDGYRFMQAPPRRRATLTEKCRKTVDELLFSEYSENQKNAFYFDPLQREGSVGTRSFALHEMPALLYFFNTMGFTKRCGNGMGAFRDPKAPLLILEGEDLWETVWLNVLPKSKMNGLFGTHQDLPDFVLPWCCDKPTPKVFNAEDYHPLTVYWTMLRDFALPEGEDRLTTVYSEVIEKTLHGKDGPKAGKSWYHPMVPYTDAKDGMPKGVWVQSALNAGDWTYLRYAQTSRKVPVGFVPKPAATLDHFTKEKSRYLGKKKQLPPVRVLGVYLPVESSKCLGILDQRLPIISVEDTVDRAMVVAVQVAFTLVNEVQRSLGSYVWQTTGSNSRPDIWPPVEAAYYAYLNQVREAALEDTADTEADRKALTDAVRKSALNLFDTVTNYSSAVISGRTKGPVHIAVLRSRLNGQISKAIEAFNL